LAGDAARAEARRELEAQVAVEAAAAREAAWEARWQTLPAHQAAVSLKPPIAERKTENWACFVVVGKKSRDRLRRLVGVDN
jgi:hypothetical protein